MKNLSPKKPKLKQKTKPNKLPDLLLEFLAVFFLLFIIFSGENKLPRNLDFLDFFNENLAINSGIVITNSFDFLESLGRATFHVYELNGRKAYDAILFTNGTGEEIMTGYEFFYESAGHFLYRSIFNTTNPFSIFFQRIFAPESNCFDINSGIQNYSSNVSSGLLIVKEDLKGGMNNFKSFLSFDQILSLPNKLTQNINGQEILNAPRRGIQILKKTSIDFVSAFSTNIKGNLSIMNKQLSTTRADVFSGFNVFLDKILN